VAVSWIVAAEQAVAPPAFEAVARVRFRMLLVARPARHSDPPADANVWLVLNREQTPQDRGSVEPRPEGTRHHSCCLNHDEADSFPPYVKKHIVWHAFDILKLRQSGQKGPPNFHWATTIRRPVLQTDRARRIGRAGLLQCETSLLVPRESAGPPWLSAARPCVLGRR